MDPQTRDALLQLNRRFYEKVALHFDATRQGSQPGFAAILPYFTVAAKEKLTVLDAGCGNGRFARWLGQQGRSVCYTGVDANAQLLRLARESMADVPEIECRFIHADLADPAWPQALPAGSRAGEADDSAHAAVFDIVISTATVQHFPGYALRLRLLQDFRRLTTRFVVLSFWQFLSRERFRSRLVSPTEIGVREAALEPGDGILPWRQGVAALRYVHQVDETELGRLAADAQLTVLDLFRADGKLFEKGELTPPPGLNLYAILRPAPQQQLPGQDS